jgi:catechol 2,3-dioxygenase-like lactoylglutathione lyase family enzyme
MEKITGIGGVFFKAKDAEALRRWYGENLGIDVDPNWGGAQFGDTVWSIFKGDTRYFDPSAQPFMINYRVANLDAMLAQLRSAGVQVDDKVDESEFGRFGWVMDPEGNRIELWEPMKVELKAEGG